MNHNKKHPKLISTRLTALIAVASLLAATVLNASSAFASTVTNLTIMETNMNTSGTAALIVSFKAGASDASGSIVLGMGSATTAVAAAPTVSTTYNSVDCKTITGATTDLPGTLTSSANTNPTITITGMTALTSGTTYGFVVGTFAAQTAVTNSASANSYPVTFAVDGTDTGSGAVDVITSDQVTVSATVPASFTMAITNPTDNFSSNLSSASVTATPGDPITISSNASHGWNLWASDTNIGLKSVSAGNYVIASKTPGSNATITTAAEGYVTSIPAANITQGAGSGGTTSAVTAYASSGSGNGSGLNTTPAIIASSTGTANSAVVKPLEYASIIGTTPAATDYTDTITYIGEGSF